jgi:hypothetical protein
MKRWHFFLFVVLVLLIVQGTAAADSAGGTWNAQWSISLDRPTPSPGYQVRVDLSPAVFDYSGAQAHGEDIRFMDTDRQGLSYWIESWDPEKGSVLWVKVPKAGTSSLVMLSGNPAAAPASSGENTFLFFDDFSGTALDTSRWTEMGDGTLTFSNGTLTSLGEKALFSRDPVPGIFSRVLEIRGKFHGWTDDGIDIGYGRITNGKIYFGESQGDWIHAHGWEGTGMTLKNANDATYCYQPLYPATPLWDPSGIFTWSLVFSPDSMKIQKDYRPYLSYNTTGCRLMTDTLPVEVLLDNTDRTPNFPQTVDWVRVRSYAPVEPRAKISRVVTAPVPGPQADAGRFPFLPAVLVAILVSIASYVFLSRRRAHATQPAAPGTPRPSLTATKEVRLGETRGIELEIANPGTVAMTGIRITIVPPADIRLAETTYTLAGLSPAESRVIPVPFNPPAKGTYALAVQVQYEVAGRPERAEFPVQVRVR